MKNKNSQFDKQKIALAGLLIAVAVGGFLFFQSSPESEVTPVAEAPVAQPEIQAQQPAAPVESAPAKTLGASSSGLGR